MAYIIYDRIKGKTLNKKNAGWQVEKFMTGGQEISNYKEGMRTLKKLRKMSSSIEYSLRWK